MEKKKLIGRALAVAGLLLLGALAAPAWAAPIAVSACGTLVGQNSYLLTADLVSSGTCLAITGNGATIDLNGHSISGVQGTGTGIVGGNNVTIKGPGIVHDFGTCIGLGAYALVEDVLAYNCFGGLGIILGDGSKCVECRVHDVRVSGAGGVGIVLGRGCLLESSIVELSDNGAFVGNDCKVWDLVVDTIFKTGLIVGRGTSVARSVISHIHDGPGIDYRDCVGGTAPIGCQDSSNSVWPNGPATPILDTGTVGVITDCATNNDGSKYRGKPTSQCPVPHV